MSQVTCEGTCLRPTPVLEQTRQLGIRPARLDEQKHQQEQKDDNGGEPNHHEPEATLQEPQEQRTEGISSCL